jgi:cysteinyl-tRNA synthetase
VVPRLYDSMRQEKRDFAPRDGDHVTMYFCGPTVYNYIHLGNARPYVLSLVAKRYFESLGWSVTLVENITDIDDRIIQKANAEGRRWDEVAREYAEAYVDDTGRLGLGRPDVEPRATEHIPEILELIGRLVAEGHAYQAGADVYFDVDSLASYGRLSKQQTAEMRHGARITPGEEKADPLDFALWKGAKPGEPMWDSPWGPGRPGWHIECSAMSLKYLGPGFDIHGGGRDLIFPHHENEVAQSEGALGGEFVRFWVHNGMLNTREEKMSKSIGNIFLLREALKEYRPEVLICYFVGSHYRSPMEFSSELLDEAGHQVERLRNLFRSLDDCVDRTTTTGHAGEADLALAVALDERRLAFDTALADDLNTAGALGEIFTLAREVNIVLAAGSLSAAAANVVREGVGNMIHILGLDAVAETTGHIPDDVLRMAAERHESRLAKDYAAADRLRHEIVARGYEVRDAAGGYKVVPAE